MLKKYFSSFLPLLFFVNLVIAENDPIPPRPIPQKLVNNFSSTGFLNADEQEQLEEKLEAFANETSNQMVIVIIDDLGGMEPWEFATKLGEKWGVGQNKFNNGIIILIKPSGGTGEKKYFIAVGKGLGGAIPDATCRKIENNELLPNLKAGHFFDALDKTTNVLMALAKGEYNSDEYAAKKGDDVDKTSVAILLIIFIVLIIVMMRRGGGGNNGGVSFGSGFLLGSMFGGGRGFGGGGGFSGGGGGFGGFGGGGFGGGGSGGSW